MAIEKYVVVSGVTGVHKLISPRSNGVFILDTTLGKSRFVAAKSTDVTPLGMITIYTETDEGALALGKVFERMRDQIAEHPVPETESKSEVLRDYFVAVIPEHDAYQVRIADIKKIVKWYRFMTDKQILDEVLAEDPTAPEAEVTEAEKAE
jgi:hypothetical protein